MHCSHFHRHCSFFLEQHPQLQNHKHKHVHGSINNAYDFSYMFCGFDNTSKTISINIIYHSINNAYDFSLFSRNARLSHWDHFNLGSLILLIRCWIISWRFSSKNVQPVHSITNQLSFNQVRSLPIDKYMSPLEQCTISIILQG